MVRRAQWLRGARGDGFVPCLYVGSVRMIVDVQEGSQQLPQGQLVVEGACLSGGAGDGESCRRTCREIAAVEGGVVCVDGAWPRIGHRVALETLCGRKKCH